MQEVKAGDVLAFAQLADRYRGPLRRFFRALLGNDAEADDAAQEILLRLWTLRDRYEPTGRFSAFLFTLARNHYRNLRERKRFRDCHEAPDADADLLPAREPLPEIALLNYWNREQWQTAIDALPLIYRQVFTLSHINSLRYTEIAEQLGIPVGTVKSRMAEAVKRLRQLLANTTSETEEF